MSKLGLNPRPGLLTLFKLRGKALPAADIMDFFAAAGADISAITGSLRDLEARVDKAARLGAVAYIPSGRGREISLIVTVIQP